MSTTMQALIIYILCIIITSGQDSNQDTITTSFLYSPNIIEDDNTDCVPQAFILFTNETQISPSFDESGICNDINDIISICNNMESLDIISSDISTNNTIMHCLIIFIEEETNITTSQQQIRSSTTFNSENHGNNIIINLVSLNSIEDSYPDIFDSIISYDIVDYNYTISGDNIINLYGSEPFIVINDISSTVIVISGLTFDLNNYQSPTIFKLFGSLDGLSVVINNCIFKNAYNIINVDFNHTNNNPDDLPFILQVHNTKFMDCSTVIDWSCNDVSSPNMHCGQLLIMNTIINNGNIMVPAQPILFFNLLASNKIDIFIKDSQFFNINPDAIYLTNGGSSSVDAHTPSTLRIESTVFSNCSNAIYNSIANIFLSMIESIFVTNVKSIVITAANSVELEKLQISGNSNGAIYIQSVPEITISYMRCADNNNYAGDGGCMTIAYPGPIINIEHSLFQNNKALNGGGAIFLYYTTYINMNNVSMSDNSAPSGGALFILGTTTNIEHSSFQNNTALSYQGGAIHAQSCTIINLNSVSMSDNLANLNGGALSVVETPANIAHSSFEDNLAFYQGGAIYGTLSDITIDSVIMQYNEAKYEGGAVWVRGLHDPTIEDITINVHIINSTVIHNIATEATGGVYTGYADILIQNSSISNNSGTTASGLFGFIFDSLIIQDSTLSDNIATYSASALLISQGNYIQIDGSTVMNNNNGAIVAWFVHTIDISNSECISNTAETHNGGCATFGHVDEMNISNSSFEANVANIYGGAIFFQIEVLQIVLENVSFISNSAYYGGAIRIGPNSTSTSNMKIINCEFQSNTGIIGSSISAEIINAQNEILIQASNFINNSASNGLLDGEGGVIWSTNIYGETRFIIKSSTFIGNVARQGGGAIWGNNSAFYLSDCVFENNGAYYGGVMYIKDAYSNIVTENTSFTGNNAYYGGCFCTLTVVSGFKIQSSVFANNFAFRGGVFQMDLGTNGVQVELPFEQLIVITDSEFYNNLAGIDGGVIFIAPPHEPAMQLTLFADDFQYKIELNNNVWKDNHAGYRGGVIAGMFEINTGVNVLRCREVFDGRHIIINNNTFEHNYVSTNDIDTSGIDPVLLENVSEMGGGVMFVSCTNIHVTDSIFDSNHFYHDNERDYTQVGIGGGILNGQSLVIEMDNVQLTHDSVKYEDPYAYTGGIFYIFAATADKLQLDETFTNKIIFNHVLVDGYKANQEHNDKPDPLIYHGGVVEFYNVDFINNQQCLLDSSSTVYSENNIFRSCSFVNNILKNNNNENSNCLLKHGGDGNYHTLMKDCTFLNNSAEILVDWSKPITFQNVHSSDNSGYFYLTNNPSINNSTFESHQVDPELVATVFYHNRSDSRVSIIDNSIAFSNCIFRNNYGSSTINIQDISSTFTNCIFENNLALGDNYGGDIRQTDRHLYIKNCSFTNSTAKHGGSIAFMVENSFFSLENDYLADISDSQFIGCQADLTINDSIGGAFLFDSVLHEADHLHMNNLTFINNRAAIGPAMAIVNEEAIVDIESENADSIICINNTGLVIPYDFVSTPIYLAPISMDSDQICPSCISEMGIEGTDLFEQEYIPFSFCLPHKCFWINIRLFLDYDDLSWSPSLDRVEIINQSSTFLNGSGTQNFTISPGIYQETISIKIIATNPSDVAININSKPLTYQFSACKSGMGAIYDPGTGEYSCSTCQNKHYRLDQTYTESCIPCPDNAICAGGDALYVAKDHYPLVYGNKFVSMACSPGSCCLDDFCPFGVYDMAHTLMLSHPDQDKDEDHLCPLNRNSSSYLCSECDAGYSALYHSPMCYDCAQTNWPYFIIVFLIFGGLVCWWGKKPATKTSIDIWELYLFRQLTFFYQILPSIVLINAYDSDDWSGTDEEDNSSNFSHFINSIVSFVNFNLPDSWIRCMYPGMTNFDKLWLGYFIPAACVVWILLCFIISQILNKFVGKFIVLRKRQFIFHARRSMIKLIIMCYAQVVRVSFMLLSCRVFPDGTERMYYAPSQMCFEPAGLMWIPMLLLIISVMFPFWAWWKSWRIHSNLNREINDSGLLATTQMITLAFEVKGREILEMTAQCITKTKQLKQQLANELKVDGAFITLSIKHKSKEVKDGLRVKAKFSVKYAKDRNCYDKLRKRINSGRLPEIVKSGWSLNEIPTIQNVDCHINMSDDTWYLTFTLPYKPESFWYEEFQMFRRFIILLVIAIPIIESERLIWIRNCLFMFIIIHSCIKPFKKFKTMLGFDSNYLELIVIYLLIVLSLTADYDKDNIHIFNNIIKSIPLLMIIPIVIRFIYIKWINKSKYQQDAMDHGGESALYKNGSHQMYYYESARNADTDTDNDQSEMYIAVDGDKNHIDMKGTPTKTKSNTKSEISPNILSFNGPSQLRFTTKSMTTTTEETIYSPLAKQADDNETEEEDVYMDEDDEYDRAAIELHKVDSKGHRYSTATPTVTPEKFVRNRNQNDNDDNNDNDDSDDLEEKEEKQQQEKDKLSSWKSKFKFKKNKMKQEQRSNRGKRVYSLSSNTSPYYSVPIKGEDLYLDAVNDKIMNKPDVDKLSTIKSGDTTMGTKSTRYGPNESIPL